LAACRIIRQRCPSGTTPIEVNKGKKGIVAAIEGMAFRRTGWCWFVSDGIRILLTDVTGAGLT